MLNDPKTAQAASAGMPFANPEDLERLWALTPIALAAFDSAGEASYLSPAFQEMTGFALADMPKFDCWRASLGAGPDLRGQAAIQLASGETATFGIALNTAASGSFVVLTPIDAEPASRLDASERIFEGIAIHRNGQFVYVNTVLAEMLKLSPEAIIGRSVLDFLAPESHAQAIEMMRDPDITSRTELVAVDSSGARFHCELLGKHYVFEGKPARLIAVRDTSTRHTAEAYRQQTAWLNLALNSTGSGTWEWNVVTNEIVWSDKLWQILGIGDEAEPLSMESWFALIHPADRAITRERLRSAAEAIRSAELEYRIQLPDGSTKWLLAHGHPFLDEQGNVVRYLGVLFDITERKRSEEALKASETLKRSILDSLSEHVAVLDGNGTIIETNTAWDRFASENGGDGKRIGLGANYLEVCGESSETELGIAIRQVIAGVLPYFQHEYPCPSPEEARWFTLTVTPLGNGQPGAVVSHANITQRKQIEQALRVERDFVSTVVEAAGNVILILDRAGCVVRFNRAAQELTGFDRAEIIGQPVWAHLIPPEQEAGVRTVFEKLLHGKIAGLHENEWQCKDGRRRLLSWCNTVLFDAEGEVSFVVAMGYDITEQRENQVRLCSTLNTMRNLLEAIPYPIFLKGRDYRYEECNEQFCKMLGVTREQVIGGTVFDVAEMSKALIYERADRALMESDDANQVYETSVVNQSGSISQVMFHKRKYFDAAGETVGLVGIVIDVTDFRRTEQALNDHRVELERHRDNLEELIAERTKELAEAEAHIRAIVESSGDGIIEVDMQGRIRLANPAATQLLGYRLDELLGKPLHAAIHHSFPDGRAYPLEACPTHKALCSGTPLRPMEDLFWRADGTSIPVGVSSHPIFADGQLKGAVLAFQDISERKAAERKNAALAAIVENSDNIIVTRDLELRVVATNAAFARAAGYSHASDLVGMTDAEIFGVSPDIEPIRSYMDDDRRAQRLGRGDFILREEPVVSPNGEIRFVLTRKYPIFDDNDTVIGTGSISLDITERKRAEEALEEARRAAEQLARTKSEFLANMSHEIRTPLNGVLGLAQIGYRDSVGRQKTQDTFARIVESGKLLQAIINDILDFSKIEAGRMDIEATPVSPARLLDDVVASQSAQASAKKLKLYCEKSADLPSACLGDSVRISQILMNLLANAIKFTEHGEVRAGVYLDGGKIIFRISDTGIGMTPEVMSRLFSPFEQADSSTTRKYGGTGLGLAISRRLAHLMGAELSVSSQVGCGSVFELHLPFLESAQAAPSIERPSVTVHRRLKGLRLLVAEDNPTNQLVLEDFLVREGAEVILVADGQKAVDMVEAQLAVQPGLDAVLMDVQMPVMDGYEATRHIRRLAPHLPVIGQTAHAMREHHERCLAAGMVATIVKPIDIDELIHAILTHSPLNKTPGKPVPLVPPVNSANAAIGRVVDWPQLWERFRGRREVIERLVVVARRTEANKPLLLRAAAQSSDHEAIARLAHGLKGCCGNLAVPEIERQARNLMDAVEHRHPDIIAQAEVLADAVDRLLEELARGIPDGIEAIDLLG